MRAVQRSTQLARGRRALGGRAGRRPPCPSGPHGAGAPRPLGTPQAQSAAVAFGGALPCAGGSTVGSAPTAQRPRGLAAQPRGSAARPAEASRPGIWGGQGSGPGKATSRNTKSFFLACQDCKRFPTFCSQKQKFLDLFAFKTKQPSKKERKSKLTNCSSPAQHGLLTQV